MPDSDCLLPDLKLFDHVLTLSHSAKNSRSSDKLNGKLVMLSEETERSYLASKTFLESTDLSLLYCPKISEVTSESSSSAEEILDHSRSTIFQAAIRIYFERALCSLSGTSEILAGVLDDAFSLLAYNLQNQRLRATRRITPLSLFLVGVEARNDYERKMLLDLITQTSTEAERWLQADGQTSPKIGFRSTGMNHVMDLLKKIWVKDDLQVTAEGYLDYRGKLHEAFSSYWTLPSLL